MENRSEQVTHNLSNDANALKYQLETDRLAKEVKKKLGLKPVRKVKEGEEYVQWVETEHNVLNKEGVERIVGLIRAFVDKNQTTSIYTEDQIQSIMEHLHVKVAREISEEWENYDVGKRGQADKVMAMVTNNVYSALNSSLEGKKLELVTNTAETKTQTVQKQEEKDNGGLF